MAEKKYIVTITRQFGSLGRPIAREMSEILALVLRLVVESMDLLP